MVLDRSAALSLRLMLCRNILQHHAHYNSLKGNHKNEASKQLRIIIKQLASPLCFKWRSGTLDSMTHALSMHMISAQLLIAH
jgi:hypothetical protein